MHITQQQILLSLNFTKICIEDYCMQHNKIFDMKASTLKNATSKNLEHLSVSKYLCVKHLTQRSVVEELVHAQQSRRFQDQQYCQLIPLLKICWVYIECQIDIVNL
jgi:hypothetical protein